MKLHCRTNLDNTGHEKWPTELPGVPRVGEKIRSSQKWGVFQLHLEVVSVTYIQEHYEGVGYSWYAEVELHMTAAQRRNWGISQWQEWYAKARGIRNGS